MPAASASVLGCRESAEEISKKISVPGSSGQAWDRGFGGGASPHCPPASDCSRNISDQEGAARLTSLGLLLQGSLSLDCTVMIHVLSGVPLARCPLPSRTEALPVMNLRQGFRRMREQLQRRPQEASPYTLFKELLCGPTIPLQWTAPKNLQRMPCIFLPLGL